MVKPVDKQLCTSQPYTQASKTWLEGSPQAIDEVILVMSLNHWKLHETLELIRLLIAISSKYGIPWVCHSDYLQPETVVAIDPILTGHRIDL